MTLTDAPTDTLATERAAALRALADHIEANPVFADNPYTTVEYGVFASDARELATLTRLLGGHREKEGGENYLTVQRDFGAGVSLSIVAPRGEVCERVQVGTREVEREVTEVIRVETVEEPVYEWRCASVLEAEVAS